MSKVVLLTGASSGIGLATAKRLLADGYTVYASARKKEGAKEIQDLGGVVVKIEMDDEKTMKSAIKQIIKDQGRIDILINNAGWGHYGPIEEIPMKTARKVMEVNLMGLARLTQLVLPHMREAGQGTIINTSSIGGKIYFPLGGWYHASKHALEGWSDCLRLELKPLNINVIIVEPGIIDTGFNEAMVGRVNDLKSTGAYDPIKKAITKAQNPDNAGSSPDVIAKLIQRVLKKSKPKTRYHAGKLSSTVLVARRLLGDRFFDWYLSSQIEKANKIAKTGSKK